MEATPGNSRQLQNQWRVQNAEDAMDIAQETLIRTYRRKPKKVGAEKAYQRQAVRNAVIDYWRRHKRHEAALEHLRHQTKRDSHEMGFDQAMKRIDVQRAIALLPLELREAILPIFFMDNSRKEAASNMRLSRGKYRGLQLRAFKLLRSTLSAYAEN